MTVIINTVSGLDAIKFLVIFSRKYCSSMTDIASLFWTLTLTIRILVLSVMVKCNDLSRSHSENSLYYEDFDCTAMNKQLCIPYSCVMCYFSQE